MCGSARRRDRSVRDLLSPSCSSKVIRTVLGAGAFMISCSAMSAILAAPIF
jgi:hypothetical protein